MLTQKQQKQAAKAFYQHWKDKQGYEKGETQAFWNMLLRDIFGVAKTEDIIEYEKTVQSKSRNFIDAYIAPTKILIEQKSADKDLLKPAKQSDGSMLTPYQQAKRYADELPLSAKPRYIIACNFREFHIHDMEKPQDAPQIVLLKDLQKEYHRLSFIIDNHSNAHIQKEVELSIEAGKIVGLLYDAIARQYKDMSNPKSIESLNKLCVRLVFCLYAEDTDIFHAKDAFRDYLLNHSPQSMRQALIDLFTVLNTPQNQRQNLYLSDDCLQFPYANGGLFTGDIEIPLMNDEIYRLITTTACEFDWSEISPTIFGAVFESTLNPETRRSGGMHYTSIENIHKVIDPLFLDDLKDELAQILQLKQKAKIMERVAKFQHKLASFTFLDPAAGSGNFLTETYISLRRIENQALAFAYGGQKQLIDPIKVSISQFYGIEINDFAVSVAQTALWIAEIQSKHQTEEIFSDSQIEYLPLKTHATFVEANALRLDWNSVIPASELNYIMGNPPFVGQHLRNKSQSDDMAFIFGKGEIETKLDYVICWYKKALDFMNTTNNKIATAFVSTNSICQGESVPTFWQKMFNSGTEIQFAYRSFRWNSESSDTAAVHCVIVGFTNHKTNKEKALFDNEKMKIGEHINPYLYLAPNIWLKNRENKKVSDFSKMTTGSPPTDDGALTLTIQEKQELEDKYPILKKYIRPFIGAREFLHDKMGEYSRYCLWFKNGNPSDYANIPEIKERLLRVKKLRQSSNADRIQKMADYPYLFCQIRQPETTYLVFPRHSSENREYIPIGFVSPEIIAGDACSIVPNVSLYEFGILTSKVHNAWLKVVAGRLKSDYRYSPTVYNNFPRPKINTGFVQKIEQTAQAILNARAKYKESSLASLYEELTMPPELRAAHKANDTAVLTAYGLPKTITEEEIVAFLMQEYQKRTSKN